MAYSLSRLPTSGLVYTELEDEVSVMMVLRVGRSKNMKVGVLLDRTLKEELVIENPK